MMKSIKLIIQNSKKSIQNSKNPSIHPSTQNPIHKIPIHPNPSKNLHPNQSIQKILIQMIHSNNPKIPRRNPIPNFRSNSKSSKFRFQFHSQNPIQIPKLQVKNFQQSNNQQPIIRQPQVKTINSFFTF